MHTVVYSCKDFSGPFEFDEQEEPRARGVHDKDE